MLASGHGQPDFGRPQHPPIEGGSGLSQEGLALEAEIDRSYMSRLERGIENPTVAVANLRGGRNARQKADGPEEVHQVNRLDILSNRGELRASRRSIESWGLWSKAGGPVLLLKPYGLRDRKERTAGCAGTMAGPDPGGADSYSIQPFF